MGAYKLRTVCTKGSANSLVDDGQKQRRSQVREKVDVDSGESPGQAVPVSLMLVLLSLYLAPS